MPLNASLISFLEAKGLGLVIIKLVSSAKKKCFGFIICDVW